MSLNGVSQSLPESPANRTLLAGAGRPPLHDMTGVHAFLEVGVDLAALWVIFTCVSLGTGRITVVFMKLDRRLLLRTTSTRIQRAQA